MDSFCHMNNMVRLPDMVHAAKRLSMCCGKKKELIRRPVVGEIHSVKGKNPTGGEGTSVARASPLKISVTPGRIRLPANSLLRKHPAPRKTKVEHKLPRAFCRQPLTL